MKLSARLKILYFLLVCSLTISAFGTKGQVLEYATTIKMSRGTKTIEKLLILQINNKEQNWLSDIEISHNANQDFELLEASVLQPSGELIRKLKKKEITNKSDLSYGTFFQDRIITGFTLHHNTYPYLVKYKYRITEKEFVYLANWYPVVYTNVKTHKASLQVELPVNYEVSLAFDQEINYRENQIGEKRIFRWELTNYMAQNPEPFSPPVFELLPKAVMVPKKFNYGVQGSAESWASFGNWLARLNADSDLLPDSERIKVKTLTEGITDKTEIVRVLYHYLQDNTRYINVAIDVGGLKPYPAAYVCENKYGDCKALTIYLKALLKEAGISSFYTVINAGSNAEPINNKLPSQQFNHVILTVPIGSDTIWLESTASYYPFNYLGTFTQGRYALLVDGNNSKLIQTPKLSLDDVMDKRSFHYQLNEEGDGDLTITQEVKGEIFEDYRYYLDKSADMDIGSRLLQNLASDRFELESWHINKFQRDEPKISRSLKGTSANQLRKIANIKVIKSPILHLPSLPRPELRKTPVRINFPINRIDSITYYLPFATRYTIEVPEDINITSAYGSYSTKYHQSNNTVTLKRSFQLYAMDLPLKAYENFYGFIESIKEAQNQSSIILTGK